jgi:hypothetical protein
MTHGEVKKLPGKAMHWGWWQLDLRASRYDLGSHHLCTIAAAVLMGFPLLPCLMPFRFMQPSESAPIVAAVAAAKGPAGGHCDERWRVEVQFSLRIYNG